MPIPSVPIAYGLDDQAPFYIATPAYQKLSLDDADTSASAHAAVAVRPFTTLKEAYTTQIETSPLEAFTVNIEAHYQALAEWMNAADSDHFKDDRM